MKALVKFASGYGNLEVRDVEEPKIGPEQVLVEVKAAGICGSDLHYYEGSGDIKTPIILGHEFSGDIVQVGAKVTGWAAGDRIASETSYHICGRCYFCKYGNYPLCSERKGFGSGVDGVFTKHVAVPARLLHRLPDNLSYSEGAVVQPAADIVHAVTRNARVLAGDTVVVMGPGPMGLLTAQVARAQGAGRVIVTGLTADEKRLEIAQRVGADLTINVQKEDPIKTVMDLTNGMGADVIFEITGAPAAPPQALDMIRKKGQIVIVGVHSRLVQLDMLKFLEKEAVMRASIMSNWIDYERAIGLMVIGKIRAKELITHEFPISDWKQAFSLALDKTACKVILTPI